MKWKWSVIFVVGFCMGLFALQGCLSGSRLPTTGADPAQIKGAYTLILYGCRYADDIENMAILVDAKIPYRFQVYALESMYKVKTDVPGPEALLEANRFLSCSMHTVWQTIIRRISDPAGATIGFEVKPLFRPWEFKTPEVLLSSYVFNDGEVRAHITLDPTLKRRDLFEDPGERWRGPLMK